MFCRHLMDGMMSCMKSTKPSSLESAFFQVVHHNNDMTKVRYMLCDIQSVVIANR